MPLIGDPSALPIPARAGADPGTAESRLQKLLDDAYRIQFSNRGSFPEAFLVDALPLVDEGAAQQALERLAPVVKRCHISRVKHAFLTELKLRRGRLQPATRPEEGPALG